MNLFSVHRINQYISNQFHLRVVFFSFRLYPYWLNAIVHKNFCINSRFFYSRCLCNSSTSFIFRLPLLITLSSASLNVLTGCCFQHQCALLCAVYLSYLSYLPVAYFLLGHSSSSSASSSSLPLCSFAVLMHSSNRLGGDFFCVTGDSSPQQQPTRASPQQQVSLSLLISFLFFGTV